jgi:hypothetical protein
LEPIQITVDGTYTARASAIYPDVYIISTPYVDGEYLLIENRQPLMSDERLWEPGGIMIWHIDENMEGYGNFVRGGPFVDGWPGNGAHYKVAVLQADGKYQLEMALNLGHNDDFWKAGDVLGPGNGELVATDFSSNYPNTDSYVGGNIQVTGLVVDQFTEMEPGVWSFRVQNLAPPLLTESPSTAPTQPTPAPTTTEPTASAVPTFARTFTPSETPSSSPTAMPSKTSLPSLVPTDADSNRSKMPTRSPSAVSSSSIENTWSLAMLAASVSSYYFFMA